MAIYTLSLSKGIFRIPQMLRVTSIHNTHTNTNIYMHVSQSNIDLIKTNFCLWSQYLDVLNNLHSPNVPSFVPNLF